MSDPQKLLTTSHKNLVNINQWKDEGIVAEKANLFSTKLPEADSQRLKFSSQKVEISKNNEDNISVYYSKAINRYERQKSTSTIPRRRSISTEIPIVETSKTEGGITFQNPAKQQKDQETLTLIQNQKRLDQEGKTFVCVDTASNIETKTKRIYLKNNINAKIQSSKRKQYCKLMSFPAPPKYELVNDRIQKFNIDLGEIMRLRNAQKPCTFK